MLSSETTLKQKILSKLHTKTTYKRTGIVGPQIKSGELIELVGGEKETLVNL